MATPSGLLPAWVLCEVLPVNAVFYPAGLLLALCVERQSVLRVHVTIECSQPALLCLQLGRVGFVAIVSGSDHAFLRLGQAGVGEGCRVGYYAICAR